MEISSDHLKDLNVTLFLSNHSPLVGTAKFGVQKAQSSNERFTRRNCDHYDWSFWWTRWNVLLWQSRWNQAEEVTPFSSSLIRIEAGTERGEFKQRWWYRSSETASGEEERGRNKGREKGRRPQKGGIRGETRRGRENHFRFAFVASLT